MNTQTLIRTALASVLVAMTTPALAIDVEPGDYIPLPAGTNAFLGYYQHLKSDTFSLDGTEVPASELSANIGIGRYLRYFDVSGTPVGVQAILPFGSFSDATVGGAALPKGDGIGDLTVGATVWPLAAAPDDLTGTTLGFTLYASAPIGDYEFGGANLGKGGTTITPQIGLIQGLGGGYFLEASYDVTYTRDFDASGIDVAVDPLHQAQVWVRRQFSPATYVALGYSGLRGGDISGNGVSTGLQTSSDQARLSVGHFISQTTQISGRIGYDFNAKDGFKAEPVFQLRLLQLF